MRCIETPDCQRQWLNGMSIKSNMRCIETSSPYANSNGFFDKE